MRRALAPIAFAVALSLPASDAHAAQPKIGLSPAEIDRLVERAMHTFEVPGVAVGVIKDGRLLVAKGYGVRRLGLAEPIDADTTFAIASNTKAFTATALAMLVDEGRLHWDDRVIDHLPQFRLADSWVTREFTVRDLLCHRSGLGLGAGDLMILPLTDFSRDEIIAGLRHLQPVTSFRSAYAYDNLLYVVAGEIVRAASGISYEQFVTQRILAPLGMTSCAFPETVAGLAGNAAAHHAVIDGKLQIVPGDHGLANAAVGGLQCNLQGLVKWLQMHLADGALPDGKRLLSEEQHREMWTPQTLLPVSPLAMASSHTHFAAYGLGWGLRDFDGVELVGHTGGLLGMVTSISLVPELKLAVIVLTNQQSEEAMAAIATQILKSYTGGLDQDWVAVFAERRKQAQAEAAAALALAPVAKPLAEPLTPVQLKSYAGTYIDPWRGAAMIRQENGGLILAFSHTDRMTGPLLRVGPELFVVRWNDRTLEADAYVRFAARFDGTIEGFTMQAVSPLTDFSFDFQDLRFTRQPEATPPPHVGKP